MKGKLISSTPKIDDSEEIVRLIRELPPAHCILKVESFSFLKRALSGSLTKCFQSTEFTSGGYNWVMNIYPKGNAKEGGEGHISIYVTMVDKLDQGSIVNVALRFFVYDQLRDNYVTAQYLKEKRFHSLKMSWGMPKFLPVNVFRDASKGFLINDSCVFGAEILVLDHGGHRQTPVLSMLSRNRKYTWKIRKFSELDGVEPSYSPTFTFGQWSWKLSLYPRGELKKGKRLSVYLELQNVDDLTKGSKLYAKYCFSVRHQRDGADYKKSGSNWFCSESVAWGSKSFMPLSDITNLEKHYLINDVLIIQVHIKAMFLLKA